MINAKQLVIRTKNKTKIKIHSISMMWDDETIKIFPSITQIFIIGFNSIEEYQNNARIYLDEYPEQKELREEYLKKWYYWENIRRQYELLKNKLIAKAIGEPYISKIPRPDVIKMLTEAIKGIGESFFSLNEFAVRLHQR